MRRGWLWAAAGLAALGSLVVMPAAAGGKNTTTGEKMTSTTRTLCIGRYLVDLPATVVIHRASFDYDWQRATLNSGISHGAFLKEAQTLEERLRRTSHKKDPSLLRILDRSKDGNSIVLAYWENDFSSYTSIVEGYRWTSDHLLKIGIEVDEDKVDIGVRDAKRALSEFRPRADDDIPGDPGFCIDGGFFAGEPEGNQEKASYRLTLKDRPDVWIRIYTDTVGKAEKQDGGLLARVRKPFPLLPTPEYLEFEQRVRKIREGKHAVGNRDAEELLEAYPNNRGSFGHHFAWEAQGKPGSTLRPTIRVDFFTGMNPEGNEHNRPASLSDADATVLFDAIIDSIRLRPTSPPKSGEAAAPPRAPLGEFAPSGAPCPQTGWWACVDEGNIEGGARRLLNAGEPMPAVVLLGEPSLWQRLKGERPRHTLQTVWKLVAYRDEPSDGEQRADEPGSTDKDLP